MSAGDTVGSKVRTNGETIAGLGGAKDDKSRDIKSAKANCSLHSTCIPRIAGN